MPSLLPNANPALTVHRQGPVSVSIGRVAKAAPDALCCFLDRLRQGALQHQCEFLTAHARGDVGWAKIAGELARKHLQHLVAGGVAEFVVDGFEIVEIEDDHGGEGADRHIAMQVEQRAAVEQAGQADRSVHCGWWCLASRPWLSASDRAPMPVMLAMTTMRLNSSAQLLGAWPRISFPSQASTMAQSAKDVAVAE